jgi:hypothetical protein
MTRDARRWVRWVRDLVDRRDELREPTGATDEQVARAVEEVDRAE